MFDNPFYRLYALTSAILCLHLLLLAALTGTVRTKAKTFVNPEDARVTKGKLAPEDVDPVLRVRRAHLNAVENAVPYFVLGALYVASGCTKQGAVIYMWTFTVSRILHSVFYLLGLQPWRTIIYAVSALALAGMAVHVIIRAV
jgi:uncharacterized MAPEG superfamily protein